MSRMEPYQMPKKLDSKNLRLCLDNYRAEKLFIGPQSFYEGAAMNVRESLEGRTLDFRKDKSGLYFLIEKKEVAYFPLERYNKGFFLEYERFEESGVDKGKKIILRTWENPFYEPYDENLPEPKVSILRNVIDHHLIEITFAGRVNLKFHSWWDKPYAKYWTVTSRPPQ